MKFSVVWKSLLLLAVPTLLHAKPLEILYVTGGGYHDYDTQELILRNGISERANVKWTTWRGEKTEAGVPKLYLTKDWSKGFDVIIHNGCMENIVDEGAEKSVAQIVKEHKAAGLGVVMLHCAMHTYRSDKSGEWEKLSGIHSVRHGPHFPYVVRKLRDHPILAGVPNEWETPKGELYHTTPIDNTVPLCEGYKRDAPDVPSQVNIWVSQHGKTRTFATTIGHHNETMELSTYLDIVARGVLWSAGKLNEDGTPKDEFKPSKRSSPKPTATSTTSENWTRFRGPNGQGISSEVNLPTEWSDTKNVAWKTPIPGDAWLSPIVYDDHIFLTTATDESKSCRVLCLDRKSGQITWNVEVHRQVPGDKRRENSYATPTPVTDGKHVYAAFSDGTIVAVDFAGQQVWKNTDVKFHSLHGLGASPMLVGDLLIMPFDGNSPEDRTIGWKVPWEDAVVLAVDTATGKTQWKGSRGGSRVGHVTPILINNGSQIVSAAGDRVQSFDTRSGERIWSIYSQGEGVTPSPALGEGLICTSSGFEAPTIRAIRPGGKGDATESHIQWEQTRGVPALVSLIYVDSLLYTITRDNIMHCLEAKTGDIIWKQRLKGTFSASPVLADGKLYFTSREGDTIVLRPGKSYDEVALNTIDEQCYASMAVSHGHFYIRTADNLYSIGPKE